MTDPVWERINEAKAEVDQLRRDLDTLQRIRDLFTEDELLIAVMKVLAPLTDEQALRLLDAARARVELTPEALGEQP
jgi:hypothetical protein